MLIIDRVATARCTAIQDESETSGPAHLQLPNDGMLNSLPPQFVVPL